MHCDVDAAWFGLAGIHGADGANLLAPHLLTVAHEVAITNDAEFALAGLGSDPGVALIAGTGSIALGRDMSGRMIQVGGWGHLLGDEGSAYDIGRRAAQAAARAADGRGPTTALLQLVLERWGLATPRQMIDHVYLTQEKAPIASLAPGVLALARRGDQVAHAIRRQTCEELAQAAIAAIDSLNVAGPVPLILGGGLLIHERDLRIAIVARIRRRRALGRVTLVKEPALWAARSLAARARSLSGVASLQKRLRVFCREMVEREKAMDDLTAGMTLDEQIGQLFVVGFPDQTPTPELLDLIQREHVGGVILFSRNVRDQAQTVGSDTYAAVHRSRCRASRATARHDRSGEWPRPTAGP